MAAARLAEGAHPKLSMSRITRDLGPMVRFSISGPEPSEATIRRATPPHLAPDSVIRALSTYRVGETQFRKRSGRLGYIGGDAPGLVFGERPTGSLLAGSRVGRAAMLRQESRVIPDPTRLSRSTVAPTISRGARQYQRGSDAADGPARVTPAPTATDTLRSNGYPSRRLTRDASLKSFKSSAVRFGRIFSLSRKPYEDIWRLGLIVRSAAHSRLTEKTGHGRAHCCRHNDRHSPNARLGVDQGFEICAVAAFFQRSGQPSDSRLRDISHAVRNLLRTTDFHPLPLLQRPHETSRFDQRLEGAGIEPRETTAHAGHRKLAGRKISLVDVGDLQFAPGRWFHLPGETNDVVIIEV